MRIIVIGCGRIGAGLALNLSLHRHAVTVVDVNPAAFERLGPSFKGETFVGSGFDREVLVRAGVERADGLAALTASDEVNVIVARIAREFYRIPRVVARVYDPRKAEIYRRLGVLTISPISLGAHQLAELLMFSQLDSVLSLGTGQVDILDAELPPIMAGRKVSDLTIPGEVHVIAITRGGRTFLPTLGTFFQEGDLVHLAALAESAGRLRALLGLA